MQPSEEMEKRIQSMCAALDEKPITQQTANNMTVLLLTEIAVRLEKIEERLAHRGNEA